MNKHTMIATREINHGSTHVKPGEALECSDVDAAYYSAHNMASYKTRELTAEQPARAPRAAPAPQTIPDPDPPAAVPDDDDVPADDDAPDEEEAAMIEPKAPARRAYVRRTPT